MLSLGDKLKKLRLLHNIPVKDFANILNMQPRNYQRYEKNEIDPPLSKILIISNVYAVSIDWLTGISNSPYSSDILLHYETEATINGAKNLGVGIGILIPPKYYIEEQRIKNYTLPTRANILTLIGLYGYLLHFPNAETKNFNKQKILEVLIELFNGNLQEPYFDLKNI
jgi:transcriptional regulator with XRE-family HTH domain